MSHFSNHLALFQAARDAAAKLELKPGQIDSLKRSVSRLGMINQWRLQRTFPEYEATSILINKQAMVQDALGQLKKEIAKGKKFEGGHFSPDDRIDLIHKIWFHYGAKDDFLTSSIVDHKGTYSTVEKALATLQEDSRFFDARRAFFGVIQAAAENKCTEANVNGFNATVRGKLKDPGQKEQFLAETYSVFEGEPPVSVAETLRRIQEDNRLAWAKDRFDQAVFNTGGLNPQLSSITHFEKALAALPEDQRATLLATKPDEKLKAYTGIENETIGDALQPLKDFTGLKQATYAVNQLAKEPEIFVNNTTFFGTRIYQTDHARLVMSAYEALDAMDKDKRGSFLKTTMDVNGHAKTHNEVLSVARDFALKALIAKTTYEGLGIKPNRANPSNEDDVLQGLNKIEKLLLFMTQHEHKAFEAANPLLAQLKREGAALRAERPKPPAASAISVPVEPA